MKPFERPGRKLKGKHITYTLFLAQRFRSFLHILHFVGHQVAPPKSSRFFFSALGEKDTDIDSSPAAWVGRIYPSSCFHCSVHHPRYLAIFPHLVNWILLLLSRSASPPGRDRDQQSDRSLDEVTGHVR